MNQEKKGTIAIYLQKETKFQMENTGMNFSSRPCERMKRLQIELRMKLRMSWKEMEVILGES